MDRDEITDMARKAGMCGGWSINETMLERFAALVRSAERGACKQLALTASWRSVPKGGVIYVLEHGCRFEGGSAFAASTSLVRAWKLMRERRIEAEAEKIAGMPRKIFRLVGPMHWVGAYDYFIIRVYDNL